MYMAIQPMARFGDLYASGLTQFSSHLEDLDSCGRWAVAIPFKGEPSLAKFSNWTVGIPESGTIGRWAGLPESSWTSSMNAGEYISAVQQTRERIAAGDVYQVNICRVRSAPLPDGNDIMALDALLREGNPAPFGGALRLPEHGIHIACASPELFLSCKDGNLSSGPIKGTAAEVSGISPKDEAENIMIVDLVRNDLSQCAKIGTVKVRDLLEIQVHPGLVQLVSTVNAELLEGSSWMKILDATFPPGSVTGAPKSTALELIAELEQAPRSIYCGAFGWVDADSGEAQLAVAIRTFWIEGDYLKFGTGAGITWNSSPEHEWEETELKARRLAHVASWDGDFNDR
jgi:para-aminobenzoate synthetase component I